MKKLYSENNPFMPNKLNELTLVHQSPIFSTEYYVLFFFGNGIERTRCVCPLLAAIFSEWDVNFITQGSLDAGSRKGQCPGFESVFN